MLRQLSHAMKNQLKAPKAPKHGHFLSFAVYLWHKDRWLSWTERIHHRTPSFHKAWIYLYGVCHFLHCVDSLVEHPDIVPLVRVCRSHADSTDLINLKRVRILVPGSKVAALIKPSHS